MDSDLVNLQSLESHNGYLALQDLWREKFADIQAKRDRAASRGQESAWRYAAGVEKGFQEAVMTLELYLQTASSEDEMTKTNGRIDAIISEIRGDKK